MKNIKLLLSLILAISVSILYTACSTSNNTTANNSTEKKIKIMTTLFPTYDFVKQIVGDKGNVELIMGPGVEPHSYEPTPKDIVRINESDLFVFTGEDMEPWTSQIVQTHKDNLKILNVSENLNLLKDEHDDHEHEHEHDDKHNHNHSHDFDEHDVKDRKLSDWYGEWQSVYPYVKSGQLDDVFKLRAEIKKDKTFEEYKDYFNTGYKTDVEKIIINNDEIEFVKNGVSTKAKYEYKGFKILTYESGKKGVRYLFETNDNNGAPKYIQFSDHNIEETKDIKHFHLYSGNESEQKVLDELKNWPTYYDINMNLDNIKDDMIDHFKPHSHDNHNHNEKAYNGEFEDNEVKDRNLSDWYGEWKSVYPLLKDGTLDEVFKVKAEVKKDKTAEEYKEYYDIGYKTDVEKIIINKDEMEFIKNGISKKAKYEYKGFKILTYESGKKGVRYLFETKDNTGAPKYVQFSDHNIEPNPHLEHFHIYFGDQGEEALLNELTNWPTYYPQNMSAEEIKEDMIAHSKPHSHSHSHDNHGHDHHHGEFDPHIWTSVKNSIKIVDNILENIIELDPANKDYYTQNANKYKEELTKLDKELEATFKNKNFTIVYGGHFALAYFANDYGLEFISAYQGFSPDAEPAPQDIAHLKDIIKEKNIKAIYHEELINPTVAKAIAEGTQVEILQLSGIHTVTVDEFNKGITYIDVMKQNLENLKKGM